MLFFSMLVLLAVAFYYWGSQKASLIQRKTGSVLAARPAYYGFYSAVWAGGIGLLCLLASSIFLPYFTYHQTIANIPENVFRDTNLTPQDFYSLLQSSLTSSFSQMPPIVPQDIWDTFQHLLQKWQEIEHYAYLMILLIGAMIGGWWSKHYIRKDFRARPAVERLVKILLAACASIAIAITLGIVLSLLMEAWRFFDRVPLGEFLFGTEWSPQTAIRADQTGSSGSFGVIPVILGTALITVIAITIAAPLGLMSAIYMAEYLSPRQRSITKPVLELLAGIPTVVYGYFAAIVLAPLIRQLGESLNLDVAAESALAAGLVMGMMIIPFVASLSDDALKAVPNSLRDGSYALGATKSETICRVLVPAALPGIIGGILLAVSRAVGETMIVVMAAGLAANLSINPLQSVTTVTVQITTLLTGDQEFNSSKTLAAFALGLLLFVITLSLNIISLWILSRYRQKYE